MVVNGVIQRKLALLDNQVLKLESLAAGKTLQDFSNDWLHVAAAERGLQVAAEIIIDIAERLLALKNAGPAATSSEAIQKLVQLGILKSDAPYSRIVRLRNLIVHQYAEVDPVVLFDILTNHLGDLRAFRDEIDLFISR